MGALKQQLVVGFRQVIKVASLTLLMQKRGACFASSNRVLSHINSNLVFQGELAGSQYMYVHILYYTIYF